MAEKVPNDERKKVPIFAMSAIANKGASAKCRKLGMTGMLYKPVSREGLMKQVNEFYPEIQLKS